MTPPETPADDLPVVLTLVERMARIENEVKWLRWLVIGVFGAILGQYLGIDGQAAQAAQSLLP